MDPRTGLCTRSWYLFFGGVLTRLGGVVGPGNEAADFFSGAEGSGEISAQFYDLLQQIQQLPPLVDQPAVDAVQQQVEALRDQVSELMKELQAIRSGSPVL